MTIIGNHVITSGTAIAQQGPCTASIVGPNITDDTSVPFQWSVNLAGPVTIGKDVGTAYSTVYDNVNGVFRLSTNLDVNSGLLDATKSGWFTESNATSDYWRVGRVPSGGGSVTSQLFVGSNGVVIVGCQLIYGTGAPNTVVTGSPCDIYVNKSGGAATTLYVKESGTATNTGWVGKYSWYNK
jgi:hypothetical protein